MEPNRRPNTPCARCGVMVYRRPGDLASQAQAFCSRSCRNKAHPHTGRRAERPHLRGELSPRWKGGVRMRHGYRTIRAPTHPRAQGGYVWEHVLVAEKMLGRFLTPGEEVHHINRVKTDNRPENLKVYASHREHWVAEHLGDVLMKAAMYRLRKAS